MVRAAGFQPAASPSQAERSEQTELRPDTLVPPVGIQPTAFAFSVRHSSGELQEANLGGPAEIQTPIFSVQTRCVLIVTTGPILGRNVVLETT